MNENKGEFSAEEMIVAQLLLELPTLISSSELYRENWTFSTTWGSKRTRSAFNGRGRSLLSCRVKATSKSKSKSKALSPSTPLSFSPSESDEKSKRVCKKNQLKTKEELLETIQQLTQKKSGLQMEVEKVKSYYDKQKALNLMLKAKRIEMSNKNENRNLELTQSLNLSFEPVQPAIGLSASVSRDDDQLLNSRAVMMAMPTQPSLVLNRRENRRFESPSGPLGARNEFSIPDLNVALDESSSWVVDSCSNSAVPVEMEMQQQQNMMNKAVAAAQARQKRLQIQRLKHVSAANKRSFSLLDSANRL